MKSILIVEDERDLAERIAFNLENEGYKTQVAQDGPSGLEFALEHQPTSGG